MELLLHLCVHEQSRKSSLILSRQQIFQSSRDGDQYPEKHRHAGWVWKKSMGMFNNVLLDKQHDLLFCSCRKPAVVGNNVKYLRVMSSRH